MEVSESLKCSIVEHYEGELALHGPTARGMNWKDEASQTLRFRVLCEVTDLEKRRVLELGSGAGHMVDYLRSRRIDADYTGIDLSNAMVQAARARHPGISFERRDVLLDPPAERYDLVFCSGLFHVKLAHRDVEWREFVRQMIRRMWDLCTVGIAFNLMTDQVDLRAPALFYESPSVTLDFCRRELSRHVTLRQDYPLYEYTLYVYRDPQT